MHDLLILQAMDGRVLQDALDEELVSGCQVQIMDILELAGKLEVAYDEAEQRNIEKRLHDLRYL